MAKSRPFSIYLLKEGHGASNSLEDNHGLKEASARNLPASSSTLYLKDNPPSEPWWKSYFGITKTLNQSSKGALLFLNTKGRCFAISFGHTHHCLKESSYEHDFGLRTALNCINPHSLRSTDGFEPGTARRRRTQVPVGSDLTYFDFDTDSTIMKGLTGQIRQEYKDLFKQATGASNLKVSSNISPSEIQKLCRRAYDIYQRTDFKRHYPNLHNIEPVKEPAIVSRLNDRLLQAFRKEDINLSLVVPDMINYQENVYSNFSGEGGGLSHMDVSMENYYKYLTDRDINRGDVDIDTLLRHKLWLVDENSGKREKFSVFRCLIYDVKLRADGDGYHLCDGHWYRADESYIRKIKTKLDECYEDVGMPPYNHGREGRYNAGMARRDKSYICLDETNISPTGQTEVEPCDLYKVVRGRARFYHVKISTRSSQLSHLFNQGVNSVKLLRTEGESRTKLKGLIRTRLNGNNVATYSAPVDQKVFEVIYVIATRKNKNKKSDNIPLFSRITLMRSMKEFELMGVKATYTYIVDRRVKAPGRKRTKKRKSR